MTKIELTISPDYVPTWTIVDAIRELFQNAIDQQKQNPDNVFSWEYDHKLETLYIKNKASRLTASSLLLGHTTKAADVATIGQFGEGYKIATLVLLRNDKKITFYNYGAREIWRPRFVDSRRFKSRILTFFIEKPKLWELIPSHDLVIEITGITEDEWHNQIVPSNLHLREDVKIIETTQYGDILDTPGKVFVSGLYVCDYEPYQYGYNFKPESIRLDRDRKMVSDFDLRWMASRMWSVTKSDLVPEMIAENKADVMYLKDVYNNTTYWRDVAAEKFKSAYGPEAIPVTNQEELDAVPQGYRGIMVNQSYGSLIKSSSRFSMPRLEEQPATEKLQEFFDDLVMRYDIAHEDVERFNEIMEEL